MKPIISKPDPKHEDPIEKKIKAIELRIEAGDMNIHDALMVAYRIGLEQVQA